MSSSAQHTRWATLSAMWLSGHHSRLTPLLTLMLTLMAGLGLAPSASAQNDWSLSFIDSLAESWPNNTIENAEQCARWSPSKGTRLSILQVGDSHIQGDFAPEATRSYLLHAYNLPRATRGFTFPFGMARSNEPSGMHSRAQDGWRPILATKAREPQALSVAGIAIDATSNAGPMRIGLNANRTLCTQPRHISVLFVPGSQSPVPMLNGNRPDTLDMLRGIASFSFSTPPDRLTLSLNRQGGLQGNFRFLGFVFDDDTSQLLYHSAGLNGADVRAHLRNTMLPVGAEILRAQIIIVSLGTNDAYNRSFDPVRFRFDYETLLRRIQSQCPDAFIIVTTPNDHLRRNGTVNETVAEAAEVIRNMAVDMGLGLWDFQRIMGGEGSIHSWSNQGLVARDGLHLSPNGYRLQGSLLGVALHRMLTQKKPNA